MAKKLNQSSVKNCSNGIKLEGDIGDLIVAESSGSENDKHIALQKDSRSLNARFPAGLVKPSPVNVLGSVAITSSDNVQFGNNTYINGPVTIITNKSGADNEAYVKCAEESTNRQSQTKPDSDSIPEKFQLRVWHKVTISAIGGLVIACICAVIIVLQNRNSQRSDVYTGSEDEDPFVDFVKGNTSSNFMVVVISSGNIEFIVTILIVLVTWGLCYKLLCLIPMPVQKTNRDIILDETSTHNFEEDQVYIAPHLLRIVSRTDWLAQPANGELDKLQLPVPWVIVAHTATEGCNTQSECVLRVRLVQDYHVTGKKWLDIGYNFLIGGDGSAYYGRGWDFQGAHTLGYNFCSIGVGFIGTFTKVAPSKKQMDAFQKLLNKGVQLGKLTKDYKIVAHRQVMSTESPGTELFKLLKELPHFHKKVTDSCTTHT